MKIDKTFQTARHIGRSLLLVITIVTVGIPTMIYQMKSNVQNAANNYGAHTLESIEELNLNDPFINKVSLQKDYYKQYLSNKFSSVDVEETIYYLKDGLSAKFTICAQNDGHAPIDVYVEMNKQKTTKVTIRLLYWHNGNFKETFQFISQDELEYIGDYFQIENAYTLLQTHYSSLKQSDYDELSYYVNYKDDSYVIEIREFKYNPEDTMEASYTIKKTF